ncbi:MAG: formate--phosphoribosylaminoimidazolecarboxamide ligase [Euryarchaeota archaeon]|nr:formate--phosphoribosylaminoimidazolecarboxamide ligase [Euryarchaeota archaeon]MBU4339505.1 formate--phosphoribosylaminoimidazolecarboxamide ligase [Euryarchaeota archaeon]MCG2736958.1 formate--phosphoribosylaminoimidazolecarboxamide ligase [Candidatus Methanoperedenaceae archaeon]
MTKNLIKDINPHEITIATLCSHTSLQIFHGARIEGFKTLGITVGKPPRFYDAYPGAKPDEFLVLENHKELLQHAEELREKNAIIVPHGSLVEYMGAVNYLNLEVPVFGNRRVLEWESDRKKSRQWLESAGIPMPEEITDPADIASPVIVKYYGAKGGKGFFIAKDHSDFKKQVDNTQPYTIQRFVHGTRYYFHYFYSPITSQGYTLSKGSLEMLGIDKRIESNVDEIFRAHGTLIEPTFVVTGNMPLVIRESLLPEVFEMGERVVEKSIEMFGGMTGPFCLETVLTDKLEFKVFEISARIVAGTNLFPAGSPYTEYTGQNISMGRRIALEIKHAAALNKLDEVLS